MWLKGGEQRIGKQESVPDRVLGKCLDPGIQGASPEKSAWGDGRPKPSLDHPPQKSSRRDPAAMEEKCAKSTSYLFKDVTQQRERQQSEDMYFYMSNLLPCFIISLHLYSCNINMCV